MKMDLYEIVVGLYAVMIVAVIIALALWIWGEIQDRIAAKKLRKLYTKKDAKGMNPKMAIMDELSLRPGNKEKTNNE